MYQKAMSMKNLSGKWYGFDIDGTIADNSAHTFGMGRIGKPIKPMCDLMKRLHAEGKRVKIFTARLSDVGSDAASQDAVKEHIWKWCDEHLGFRPEITDRKDYKMECLYDDRVKQLVRNKGVAYEALVRELAKALDDSLHASTIDRKAFAALRDRCADLGLL